VCHGDRVVSLWRILREREHEAGCMRERDVRICEVQVVAVWFVYVEPDHAAQSSAIDVHNDLDLVTRRVTCPIRGHGNRWTDLCYRQHKHQEDCWIHEAATAARIPAPPSDPAIATAKPKGAPMMIPKTRLTASKVTARAQSTILGASNASAGRIPP
jgi:hypothetical protein